MNLTVQNDIVGVFRLNSSFSCTVLKSAGATRYKLSSTGDVGSALWVNGASDVWIENFVVDVPWLNTTGSGISCQTPYYKYTVQNCASFSVSGNANRITFTNSLVYGRCQVIGGNNVLMVRP